MPSRASKETNQSNFPIKRKCSPQFLHFFFPFSLTFQMAKLKLVASPIDGCLQEHCGGQDSFLLQWVPAAQKMRKSAAPLLRQLILHLLWQCP